MHFYSKIVVHFIFTNKYIGQSFYLWYNFLKNMYLTNTLKLIKDLNLYRRVHFLRRQPLHNDHLLE